MKLWGADISKPDLITFVSGFVVQLPSGRMLQIAWRTQTPIEPVMDAAKKYAADLLTKLLEAGLHDDADRTNWPSVVAAVQRIIMDFNEKVRADLRASAV